MDGDRDVGILWIAITSMVLISFVVLLMFIAPLPHNAMQKPGSYQISPSVSSSSIPMWLFNGSYANYTGYYNGISMFDNFSISKIDLSSGVYCVSIHTIYGGNLNFESHLNGTSYKGHHRTTCFRTSNICAIRDRERHRN